MRRSNFYLLCALPVLPAFGGPPPLSRRGLLDLVAEAEGPVALVETLLLFDDLLEREAVLCGELLPHDAVPSVISSEQARGDAPLPEFLRRRDDEGEMPLRTPLAADPLWQRYFQHALQVSKGLPSPFLSGWVAFETGLRNALAAARAKALKLDPQIYLVALELADPPELFEALIREWAATTNPLAAHELLERHRWAWVEAHDEWYSFGDAEVGAYALRLMLLQRWHRIARERER